MTPTTPSAQEGPVVVTAAGAVRGVLRADGSAAFLGVPFARPPVGPLRFAAPVPPEPWEGVRDATAYGATPLRVEDEGSLIPEPAIPGDATLNVNVFTPRPGDADAGLPVVVWIHGGAYVAGSPASPWYDGRAFARDGVVLASISYRLGFDGFGDIPGAPDNRGVRDWIAGLEWVRDNIAAFGGDPARVTIAGQSAGGGAVLTLLGMPAAQHLFHAAWASSAALGDVPRSRAREHARRLAAVAGVAATREGFASVPEDRLLALQQEAARATDRWDRLAPARELLSDGGLPWAPMIDGDLVPRPVPEAIAAGVGADKPLVIGATDDEATLVTHGIAPVLRWVPAALALGALGLRSPARGRYLRASRARGTPAGAGVRRGTPAIVGRFVTDRVFRSTVARVVDARGDAPTWVYRFAWASTATGWSTHCLDVPFLFDSLALDGVARIAGPHPPQAVADALHASAVDFARVGAPPWPRWDPALSTARVFGAPPGAPDLQRDPYADTRPLLDA